MKQYVLTEEELANFSNDDFRAGVRSKAAETVSVTETVVIVNSEGDIYDTLQGSIPDEDFGVVLTDEQIRERRESEAVEAAEIARYEREIKPKVYQKIRTEIRAEFRRELAESKETILKLRAELAAARKVAP